MFVRNRERTCQCHLSKREAAGQVLWCKCSKCALQTALLHPLGKWWSSCVKASEYAMKYDYHHFVCVA